MVDFREQWPKVDWDFLKELANLHNQVSCGFKTQEDFNNFILSNKDKINNPDYLQIFAENIELFDEEFYKANFEMCKLFFDFMQSNPDWSKLSFGLRTFMRLGCFEDSFKEFLDKTSDEKKVN